MHLPWKKGDVRNEPATQDGNDLPAGPHQTQRVSLRVTIPAALFLFAAVYFAVLTVIYYTAGAHQLHYLDASYTRSALWVTAALGAAPAAALGLHRQRTSEDTARSQAEAARHQGAAAQTSAKAYELQVQQEKRVGDEALHARLLSAVELLGAESKATRLSALHSLAAIVDAWVARGDTREAHNVLTLLLAQLPRADYLDQKRPDDEVDYYRDVALTLSAIMRRRLLPENPVWGGLRIEFENRCFVGTFALPKASFSGGCFVVTNCRLSELSLLDFTIEGGAGLVLLKHIECARMSRISMKTTGASVVKVTGVDLGPDASFNGTVIGEDKTDLTVGNNRSASGNREGGPHFTIAAEACKSVRGHYTEGIGHVVFHEEPFALIPPRSV